VILPDDATPKLDEIFGKDRYMAPKPARFAFAVAMALTILAAMTWAMAEPSPSIYPIYQPQLPLLY
jgi:uncharacterized phage infection (PIP) family protein YhgE